MANGIDLVTTLLNPKKYVCKNSAMYLHKFYYCEERVVVTSFLSIVSVRIENRKGENSKNHFCRKLILVYI
ncbi:hypothetical protein BpHYR1_011804, partial [Brachionus plicatilis]